MIFIRLLLAATFIIATFSPCWATSDILGRKPVFYEKETDNRIEVVKTFLTPRAVDGRVKIWVFFTDKKIFDKSQFDRLAATVTISERALKRRAKMGITDITFGDLPVANEYIDEVISRGGQLRRVSQWLNAASYEIDLNLIDEINGLPFVARVKPVAVFKREPIADSPDKGGDIDNSLFAPTMLNYGNSLGQLQQINVPVVHEMGYNGEGVLVAMFDTGFRKAHEAFTAAINSGRLIDEYDFIFDDGEVSNEPEDASSAWNHGTSTWSTLGGAKSGKLYGPAYGASFLLCKTEDIRSETQVEEDNWVAAVEWSNSLGAEVISSSLSYSAWYTYSDYDGQTATTTIAANNATAYGIVVCNSMGNSGPGSGTLGAPADAIEILSVGAVNSSGTIASFSSRGPTADGRIKPEVCAQGVSVYVANSGLGYSYSSGTSFSCPLTGGCAAVLISARPGFTPQLVRQALMETASQSGSPDNAYGWGIIDLEAAINWGANFDSDIQVGQAPLTVTFSDNSTVPTSDWSWDFGDGGSDNVQNPVYTYTTPGLYDVSLTIDYDGTPITAVSPNYILALADTIKYVGDTTSAGMPATVSIELVNTQELTSLEIPIDYTGGFSLSFDSVSVAGTRADGFSASLVAATSTKLVAHLLYTGTPLAAGSGTVMRFHFTTGAGVLPGETTPLDSVTLSGKSLILAGEEYQYVPAVIAGQIVVGSDFLRGDSNGDGAVNLGDAGHIINYVFYDGPAPEPFEAGDANSDTDVNLADASFIINYIFNDGPAPGI